MKTNKILFGGIAGGLAFFLLGWLIYGVLLMDYSTANYNQCAARQDGEMVWWALIVSNLAYGFLFSFIFSWSNTKGLAAGAKMGAILGLLIAISVDLGMYAMNDFFVGFTPVIVDIVVYVVLSALVGMAVAFAMGFAKKTE